jgi:hypothetical protein
LAFIFKAQDFESIRFLKTHITQLLAQAAGSLSADATQIG